jgi:hypothetical protein
MAICPAWKRLRRVSLHSRADDVVPLADSVALVRTSGLPTTALVEVGSDHRLADPKPLRKMLEACEQTMECVDTLPAN